jgi:hypothetical protein
MQWSVVSGQWPVSAFTLTAQLLKMQLSVASGQWSVSAFSFDGSTFENAVVSGQWPVASKRI